MKWENNKKKKLKTKNNNSNRVSSVHPFGKY